MKKILRIIGLVMVAFAVGFVAFALNNPQLSFPWSNTVTWSLYGAYAVTTVVLLIAPVKGKKT